jgi:hypothetical protein
MNTFKQYIQTLGIENWVMVYSGPEALELCDELAEKIYEEKPDRFLACFTKSVFTATSLTQANVIAQNLNDHS